MTKRLGPTRIIVYNSKGEEISRQIYDLAKARGVEHWEALWKWALHQSHSLHVEPQAQVPRKDFKCKPMTK